MVVVVEDDLLRADELAGLGAVAAPLEQEAAVGREFLDAVVLAVFGNVEVALRVLGHAGHEAELARLLALLAAQRPEQLALGRIDQHLEVMRVGHQEVAVAIEAQAGRLAVGVVGRGPTAEERAVGREDLDAGGLVDDVELVVAVDGDRPGRLEAAVGDARPSPDRLDAADARFIVDAAGKRSSTSRVRQRATNEKEIRATEYSVPSTEY